jgi:hypothetical protein
VPIRRIAAAILPHAATAIVVVAGLGTLIGLSLTPETVAAHALGRPFQLPISRWFFLGGAGLAVAASFIISAIVVRVSPDVPRYPRLVLPGLPTRLLTWPVAATGLVWWYGAIVAAIVIGGDSPVAGILFWIFIWVGLPILSAVVGNPWPSLSPFRSTFTILERMSRFFGFDRLDLGLQYPAGLARWPAVFLLFAGMWSELVMPDPSAPDTVAFMLVGYTLITLVGMACFGRVAWLRNAELFEVLLGWFGRVGPIGRRVTDANACGGCGEHCDPDRCVDCPECAIAAEARERRPELRPWFAGLTEVRRGGWSDAGFIVLALAGVTYDGLRSTSLWVTLTNWFFSYVYPALDGFKALLVTGTVGLLAIWLAFLLAFTIGATITRLLSDRVRVAGTTLGGTVGAYAATLLPIAAGYFIAHYLTLVLQGIVWLPQSLHDPRAPAPPLNAIPTSVIWYLSVGAIVLGHVAAIVLSHRIALRDAPSRPILAGIPLALLMIGYTVLSLWIISQPLVVEPGQPAAIGFLRLLI